jgi:hypothetical protein
MRTSATSLERPTAFAWSATPDVSAPNTSKGAPTVALSTSVGVSSVQR